MATYTDNLHLEKPAQSDLYNISVFNGNADIIDSAMAARALAQNQATIEASSTASRNYSKGEYLVYNGLLYKVTSAISSGGAITPGTNCVATNTGAELTSLNTALAGRITQVEKELTTNATGYISGSGNGFTSASLLDAKITSIQSNRTVLIYTYGSQVYIIPTEPSDITIRYPNTKYTYRLTLLDLNS